MQPAVTTLSASTTSLLKRWFWNWEVRILLIHYGIWVAISLVSGWFIYTYMSADAIGKYSPIMAKYQNDWRGYVRMSLVGDLIYVLPTHISYSLF